MAAKKEKVTFEREYVIPLRKGVRKIVRHKKTPRAIREIIEFLRKHTKAPEVKIGMHLNTHMWSHGIKNPPTKVKVNVSVKDGVARAELYGKTYKEAVKADKKEEPKNLKEKLEAKMGKDEPAAEAPAAPVEKKAEEPKAATESKADAKPKPRKKAAPKKKDSAE